MMAAFATFIATGVFGIVLWVKLLGLNNLGGYVGIYSLVLALIGVFVLSAGICVVVSLTWILVCQKCA